MQSSIPSLTLDGWITNKSIIFYKLYEYFLTSEYSQSNIYYGHIASLKYLIATKHNDEELVSAVEDVLSKLYLRYFDEVNIDCNISSVKDVTGQELYRLNIGISATDTDVNKTYYLTKPILMSNTEILNLEHILGELYRHYTLQ